MSVSRVKEVVIDNDNFTDKEIIEIESAMHEVSHGEWVDYDEFRKTQNI